MAKNTSNLKLLLWEGTDFPNYSTPNTNMNIIDNAFGTISAQVTENTSDIETVNTKVAGYDDEIEGLNEKVTGLTNTTQDLKDMDTTLEAQIQTDKADISVLKNRVTKVENDSNLLRYYQITDSGSLNYQTKKQKKYKATATLTKNSGTDNNNFLIDSATIADRQIVNTIQGDIYVNIPKTEITNISSTYRVNPISSLFSSDIILSAPYVIQFDSLTDEDSNYKLHFKFYATWLSQFSIISAENTMDVEFYFEILQ